MEEYLKEEYVDKESIMSYEKSDIIVTIFFAIIDILVIVVSSLNLKARDKNITILKHQLIKIFIIDIIMRMLYTKKYSTWSISKELLLTILNSCQFYLVISFLYEVAFNPKATTTYKKSIARYRRFRLCILFFMITFSYEKLIMLIGFSKNVIIIFKKIIIFLQSIFIICCLNIFYKDFKKKIFEIINNIINEKSKIGNIGLIIMGSPQSILVLYLFYFFLKIIVVFIKTPLFHIYANILLNILKDTCKYFMFFLCEAIIYLLNQIKSEKEKESRKELGDIEESDIINI